MVCSKITRTRSQPAARPHWYSTNILAGYGPQAPNKQPLQAQVNLAWAVVLVDLPLPNKTKPTHIQALQEWDAPLHHPTKTPRSRQTSSTRTQTSNASETNFRTSNLTSFHLTSSVREKIGMRYLTHVCIGDLMWIWCTILRIRVSSAV